MIQYIVVASPIVTPQQYFPCYGPFKDENQAKNWAYQKMGGKWRLEPIDVRSEVKPCTKCGHVVDEPFIIIDENAKKLYGVFSSEKEANDWAVSELGVDENSDHIGIDTVYNPYEYGVER